MSKPKTDSFVLELKLNTNKDDARFLSDYFYYAVRIQNSLIRYCKKKIRALRQDRKYRDLLTQYLELSDEDSDKKRLSAELNKVVRSYDLSKYQLYNIAVEKRRNAEPLVNSRVAQELAERVWRAVEKVLYSDGKELHFCKFNDITSFAGNDNKTGVIYKDHKIKIGKRQIAIRPAKTDYEKEALTHRVKYCRIVRKAMGIKFHYYVQLTLEGKAPVKHKLGTGTGGLDIGTSTVAFASDTKCILTLLGEKLNRIEEEKARVQRAMDRSRRAMNPNKYHPDGTYNRKDHSKWKVSNHYRKLRMYYKTLCRKYAAALKQEQEILANRLVSKAATIYVEKMNFNALKKRSKKETENPNKRRKRYGYSIQVRAPGQFVEILKRKLTSLGGELIKINTKTFKASQYDHTTDTYAKKKLSKRYNMIGGKWRQRDLYSAFLLKNSAEDLLHCDRDKCFKTYVNFERLHDLCIEDIKRSTCKIPKSFGFSR